MYESGNALRGIFLTAFVALLLFSSFIFCFHLERPDAMTVEPGDDRVLFLPSGYRRLSSIGKQRRSDGEGSDGIWLNCWFNVCKFDGYRFDGCKSAGCKSR